MKKLGRRKVDGDYSDNLLQQRDVSSGGFDAMLRMWKLWLRQLLDYFAKHESRWAPV